MKFTDCIEISGAKPAHYEGTKQYVSTGAVEEYFINKNSIEEYTYNERPSRADLVGKSGDILFAKMAETKKTLILDKETENYLFSTGFFAIRPKSGILTTKCLYYLLNSKNFLSQKDKNSSGATQKAITNAGLEKINVNIPLFSKQNQIVKQFDLLTGIIKKYQTQLEKLDLVIKSRFIEMFGDILAGKYKFETRKLGEISEVGSSHRVFTTEFVEHGIPFYRGTEIGELANGKIPQKTYYISEEHYQRLIAQDSKPQIGDLLMPSICNKGQVWMVDTEEPFYYKDGRVLSISPNREIYNSKYLQYFMREKTLVEYPKLGSGSTFAEFKIFLLKDIDILTPPLSLQNDFAAFVQQIDKSKFAVQKSLEKAETLYKSLMQKYFG